MMRRIALALGIAACLAAQAAAAQEKTATGGPFVVFPLEGVNVHPGITRASSEVLTSALRNQGFDIVDWEPPRPAAPAAAPEAPVPPPPAASPSAEPAPLIVDRAAPPPAPGSAPVAPADAAAPAAPELTTQRKGEIAKQLVCAGYIDGKLVRLGTKVRISINRRSLDGKVVESRESEAKTEDDIVGVLERIAMAFAGDQTVDETLNLDNATMAETQRQAQRFRLEKNVGVTIGGMFGIADTMDTGGLIGLDARLEIKQLLVILNVGFGIASPDKYDDSVMDDEDAVGMQLWLNVDVDGYLSKTPITPYLGAGVGMFLGGRVHIKEEDKNNDGINGVNDTDYKDSVVGFEVHPTMGVEFLRHSAIRVHLEMRYSLNFAVEGVFGHGPMVMAGIAF